MTVYFAQPCGGGPIKIGSSNAPEERAKALSTLIPQGVEIVAHLEGQTGREFFLHTALAPWCINNELFRSCVQVWRTITEIADTGELSWLPNVDSLDVVERSARIKALAVRPADIVNAKNIGCPGAGFYGRLLCQAMIAAGDLPDWIISGHLSMKGTV
jgi:hypothetical protein